MSKHKHFHSIRTPVQALQHGRKNGIGPMVPRFVPRPRPTAGDKETTPP